MTISQLSRQLSEQLSPVYGADEAPWLVRIIFDHIKGWSQTDILLHGSDDASDFIVDSALSIARKCVDGTPIQYVLGEAWWHGMRLKVTPAVLIPRPETSMLVDIIADDYAGRTDLRVLDVCTGSGCIAIALARTLDFPEVVGVDISPAALEVARENARLTKTDVAFAEADALHPLPYADVSYDIIVANPPYVLESEKAAMSAHVVDHEPPTALFVPDSDPLRFYLPIARDAMRHLKEGGRLYFEINPLTAAQLSDSLKGIGFENVAVINDSFGKQRFISAVRP